MNTRRIRAAVLVLAAGLSGTAQATLYDRGGGLIYDSDLNVTWLKDANYAQSSGYDADGLMTWAQAKTWATNLIYHDNLRNVDLTGWRLPTAIDTGTPGCYYSYSGTDCGYNVNTAGNELAYLFYNELGKTSIYTTGGILINNHVYDGGWGPFINVYATRGYWSGTPATNNTPGPRAMFFYTGYVGEYSQSSDISAWAVRPGDVPAVASIPEPEAYAMLLAGLGLVAIASRHRA